MKKEEVLKIIQSQGVLSAIRYVRTETGLPLQDCRDLINRMKTDISINPIGTITWYSCGIVKPPITDTELNASDSVLIWKEGCSIANATYNSVVDKFFHVNGNWQPTHWAFINLP